MLPSTLFVLAMFIWVAMANGFIWSTIVFGLFAGLGLLALVVRLLFPKYWQPR
jgi:multisubunit Na+/H+ antiporter MnhE subunit